jgi:hypothetical protein
MKKLRVGFGVITMTLVASALLAQADFPAGIEGELYYAPRIDLVPAGEGGPYEIELDGILDEPAWERAAFQGWVNTSDPPRELDPPEEDADFIWAAVADRNFLYVAWKVADDSRAVNQSIGCDVWQDDSIELYFDARNNGPDCLAGTTSCYEADDTQLTIGVDQIGVTDPELLQFGGVGAAGLCDFAAGPAPEVMKGIVIDLQEGDIDNPFGEGSAAGWQGEIAIALDTIGNADDGTPTWTVDPSHGFCTGWNLQLNDDDEDPTPGTQRDHKLIWSLKETTESSWRNPGAFGKLQFIDPTQPLPSTCPEPIRNLTCGSRSQDDSVTLTWTNPPSANPAVMTEIQVDGAKVSEVPGDATSATLTVAQLPKDNADHVVTVINNSTIPQSCTFIGTPFAPCGAIRRWNILGAYDNPGGAQPTEEQLRGDYMTDGTTSELDFEWAPGATIDTAFGTDAASTMIDGGPAGRNPGGVPTVFEWVDADGRVDFQQAFGGDLDNVMAYAQCYVINNTGADIEGVYLAMTSDDSIQVFLNGEEVWWNSIPRAGATPCLPQDRSPDGTTFIEPFTLLQGSNSLILKVFDGTGGWEYGFRFEDEAQIQLSTEDLDIQLTPPPVTGLVFRRGDSDSSGDVNLTDAIRILNVLFLGIGEILCLDSADADDSGAVNLTDAIRILNVLFLGIGEIGPPGTQSCGPDPAGTSAGCASYPAGC